MCHIGWKWQLKIGILHILFCRFFFAIVLPALFFQQQIGAVSESNKRTWNNEPLINEKKANNSKKGIYCRQHFKGKNWTEIAQFPSHARLLKYKNFFLCMKFYMCTHKDYLKQIINGLSCCLYAPLTNNNFFPLSPLIRLLLLLLFDNFTLINYIDFPFLLSKRYNISKKHAMLHTSISEWNDFIFCCLLILWNFFMYSLISIEKGKNFHSIHPSLK